MDGIQGSTVTKLGANKLAPRYIGPFNILKVIGDAYTLDIPTAIRLHPTFYVERLKPYVPAIIPAPVAAAPQPVQYPRHETPGNDAAVVTGITDEAPAKNRGARRRDESDDDHTRGVDMDISAAKSTLRRLPIVAPCSHPVAPASRVCEGVGTSDRHLTWPNLPSEMPTPWTAN
ncbi:unnamed protein product [Phytophthora fragariaefolia]|uniref:Unnamed protein product n=1 Tax=Phytophthora fragariaefolia TaxID=1490495 RepID=A0A9W6XXL7_9STRA|nr:unnamed protein product [Phytophthora fragariaefolia]